MCEGSARQKIRGIYENTRQLQRHSSHRVSIGALPLAQTKARSPGEEKQEKKHVPMFNRFRHASPITTKPVLRAFPSAYLTASKTNGARLNARIVATECAHLLHAFVVFRLCDRRLGNRIVSNLVARRERHKLDVRRRNGIIAEGPLHGVEVVRPDGHQRAASANVLVQLVLRVTSVRGGHSTPHKYKGVKHPAADPHSKTVSSTNTTSTSSIYFVTRTSLL